MNAPLSSPTKNRDDDRFANELGLLGALLAYADPALYRAAAAICEGQHFHDAFNARLFEAIGRGVESGLHSFRLTHWIIGEIKGDQALRELGVSASAMVARYCASAFPAIAVEGAARQVRHDHLSVELAISVEDGMTGAAEEIAAEMERLSRAHLQSDTGLQQIGAAASDVLNALSAAYQSPDSAADFAYPGSYQMRQLIGGWRRGRLYILAGRPSMGKTTVALSWLLRTAKQGHGVFLASLEMGRQELVEVALCDISYDRHNRVEYRDIAATAVRNAGFEEKFRHVYAALPRLAELPIMISDRASQTVAEIRSQAQQYAQRLAAEGKRLDVIAIDHMNKIKASGAYAGNKVAETEEISAALKQLAKDLQCAVICLCQLNRAVEGREEKRPGLSDLRWSGAIEQDADVVMFVYREAYYLERSKHDDMDRERDRGLRLEAARNRLEVIFGKHRGGPCPVLEFYADMGCGAIRDMEAGR
jgi:replicative DNA helicase